MDVSSSDAFNWGRESAAGRDRDGGSSPPVGLAADTNVSTSPSPAVGSITMVEIGGKGDTASSTRCFNRLNDIQEFTTDGA